MQNIFNNVYNDTFNVSNLLHGVPHFFAASGAIDTTIDQSKSVLQKIAESVFNVESVVTFVIAILFALVLGRVMAMLLRRITYFIGAQADKTDNLATVTKLRRVETLVVLSIAVIRVLLVCFAVYFWWAVSHPHQQPSALLGAGALLAIILTGVLGPILRDLAYGASMMAEHWYGVGDHVSIDPLVDGQGIVERVTLRSTKIRGVNGEVIWVNNQNIWAVRVTPKGLRTVAMELFVNNADAGAKLIDDVNLRLPIGPLMVASPLNIMTQAKIDDNLWHITALSEVAPGREWFIDKFAIDLVKELDADGQVLVHEPISRYADSEAERRFARTIRNARKPRLKRQPIVKKVAHKRPVHAKPGATNAANATSAKPSVPPKQPK